jgi:O-antigen/teichoic acid export membrane protein
VSADHSRYALYWGNVLLTTLSVGSLATLLVIGVGPLLAHSYSQSMLAWIAVANCLFAQLTLAAGRVFQTFEQMRTTALLNLLTNLLRTLAAAILLIGWHRATAGQWAFAAMLASLVATVVAVWVVRRRYGPAEFSVRLARDRAGEGLVFALCYSTSGFYNDLDKAMLGHYGMNVANGIYTMAYRAVDVCTMPLYAIQAAAFPRFFKKGEVEGLGSTAGYALKILKRTAPYGALASAAMFLVAPLIPWVLGSGFSESTEALRWLCLLPLFRSFHISAGDAIAGGGHVPVRLATQSVAAVFNFAVNLYLIPRYSWHGAAWSSLATDGLLAILNWTVLLAMAERARNKWEFQ